MSETIPKDPKIYHIVHLDRLESIISKQYLLSDTDGQQYDLDGTTIGMSKIKERRMYNNFMNYPDLCVGACVPFYFCPRSIMLYIFYENNHPEITYRGGQEPIVHLVADLRKTVTWAESLGKRWVFTDSNAGSSYFNDFAKLNQLNQIDWNALRATSWSAVKEKKQAEFLIEECFPWELIECIGVYSIVQYQQVAQALQSATHRPPVKVMRTWYY